MIRANLSKAAYNSVAKMGVSGEVYYSVDVEVVVFFGSTELTAQMAWRDNVSHEPSFFFSFCFSDYYRVSRGLNSGEYECNVISRMVLTQIQSASDDRLL